VSLLNFRASYLGSKPYLRSWPQETLVSFYRELEHSGLTPTADRLGGRVPKYIGQPLWPRDLVISACRATTWTLRQEIAVRLSKTISLCLRQAKPRLRHHHKCVPNCHQQVFHFFNLSLLPLCLSSHRFPQDLPRNHISSTPLSHHAKHTRHRTLLIIQFF
jgi:hypothetical protein